MKRPPIRPWTPREDEALRNGVKNGLTHEQIGKAIGRSKAACSIRARAIDARTNSKHMKLTPSQIKAIEAARERGWTWRKIADKIGVKYTTLLWRWNHR